MLSAIIMLTNMRAVGSGSRLSSWKPPPVADLQGRQPKVPRPRVQDPVRQAQRAVPLASTVRLADRHRPPE